MLDGAGSVLFAEENYAERSLANVAPNSESDDDDHEENIGIFFFGLGQDFLMIIIMLRVSTYKLG